MTAKRLCLSMAVIIGCLLLGFCCLCSNTEAATTPPVKAAAAAPVAGQSVDARAAATERLPLRTRIDMGLTLSNMMRVAKELKAAGVPVTADAVRLKIAEEKPKQVQAGMKAGANWDSILAFIEKLLPLILQLISLFGDAQPSSVDHIAVLPPMADILANIAFEPIAPRASCASCSGGCCAVAIPATSKAATITYTEPLFERRPLRRGVGGVLRWIFRR